MVRLAQAHARLLFRTEVTLQDAIISIIMMEISTATAPLLGQISVLRSTFGDEPDEEYKEAERVILDKLQLDRDGNPTGRGYDGGGFDGAGNSGGCGDQRKRPRFEQQCL